MTVGWRHYRYLAANRALLGPLGQMEARVSSRPLYQIPKSRVASIEGKLRSGDVIGIVSRDGRRLFSTSHVGLAFRHAGRVAAFHARLRAAELREGRDRLDAFELSLPVRVALRDSGRAAGAIAGGKSGACRLARRVPVAKFVGAQRPLPHYGGGLEVDDEFRAFAGALAEGADRAVVHLDDRLADGEAESEAFPPGAALLERFENFVEMLGLDADAGIADLDPSRPAVAGSRCGR